MSGRLCTVLASAAYLALKLDRCSNLAWLLLGWQAATTLRNPEDVQAINASSESPNRAGQRWHPFRISPGAGMERDVLCRPSRSEANATGKSRCRQCLRLKGRQQSGKIFGVWHRVPGSHVSFD